jgi:hypothetical protein
MKEILLKTLRTIANHLNLVLPDLSGLTEDEIDYKMSQFTRDVIDTIDIKIDDAFENGCYRDFDGTEL